MATAHAHTPQPAHTHDGLENHRLENDWHLSQPQKAQEEQKVYWSFLWLFVARIHFRKWDSEVPQAKRSFTFFRTCIRVCDRPSPPTFPDFLVFRTIQAQTTFYSAVGTGFESHERG